MFLFMSRIKPGIAAFVAIGLWMQTPPSSAAEMSASEEQIYMFGLHLGWAAAECNLYEQGKITKSTVTSTFTRIGQDKDLSDLFKSAVYQTIEKSGEFTKCRQALEAWKTSQ